VNSTDETSSLESFYLESLQIDPVSMSSLGRVLPHNKSFAKYFSQIKNLQFEHYFSSEALRFKWDMVLLASQTLTTLDLSIATGKYLEIALRLQCAHEKIPVNLSDLIPFHLGQLPALRHFKVQVCSSLRDTLPMFSFLNRLFSISSSTSDIETLGLNIFWRGFENEDQIAHLFSFGAGWTLDGLLSSEKFVSLSKVVLDWELRVMEIIIRREYQSLVLSYINDLFPKLKRSQRITLETHLELAY